MDSKSQFYALEVMCRERAAVAKKDLEYWLAEAEEWAQLRVSGNQADPPRSNVSHSTELNDVLVAITNLASFLRAGGVEGVDFG